MSKTIIITTDEMKKILYEYLYDESALTDVYCQHCLSLHDGFCPLENTDFCPDKTSGEYLDRFVDVVFANYMIPFS